MKLSTEQRMVYEKFLDGENLFISGPAGVGKSALIKKMLKHVYGAAKKKISVCALTGSASILLECGATTLHSWAGIGLGNKTASELVSLIAGNKYKRANWLKTQVLITDEISMLSRLLFEKLDIIGRAIRPGGRYLPFGGIQLVFMGDFYQLPPVCKDGEAEYCFESYGWFKTFPLENNICLTKIFRQEDPKFIKLLNEVRRGSISEESYKLLNSRLEISKNVTTDAPVLFPKRKQVFDMNTIEYNKLTETVYTYDATEIDKLEDPVSVRSSQAQKEYEYKYLMTNLNCEESIDLKLGTKVMCVANLDLKCTFPICNGSLGTIISFENGFPVVEFVNGREQVIERHIWASEKFPDIGIKQIPLILAWSITTHKAQGTTLDRIMVDVGSNVFESGQTYVALSRVRTLEGLFLSSFDSSKIKSNKKVDTFYKKIEREVEEISFDSYDDNGCTILL